MRALYVRRRFVALRLFGWQIDYRRFLPLGVRQGWTTDWIVVPVGHRRWITIGRVR